MTTTLDKPRVEFDQDVDAELAGAETPDYGGWFCIRTAPFPCPADGCDFVAQHMTAAHRIVVWPDKDDRTLLSYARDAHKFGRDPSVAEYTPSLGPCIAYAQWYAIGRPVHGMYGRPDGWPDTPKWL